MVGNEVRVGDWVRVLIVPESVAQMPHATKRAFARAVGKTFQIEAFDEVGCAELDLTGKVGHDTIWIEPFCLRRFRRPIHHSPRFRRVLVLRRKLDRPRWSLRYVAKYRPTDNPHRLVAKLQRVWISHGWHVLEQQREIHGTFFAQDSRLGSKRRLNQLRQELRSSDLFLSLQLDGVRLRS
jgi:hypothetical protein